MLLALPTYGQIERRTICRMYWRNERCRIGNLSLCDKGMGTGRQEPVYNVPEKFMSM